MRWWLGARRSPLSGNGVSAASAQGAQSAPSEAEGGFEAQRSPEREEAPTGPEGSGREEGSEEAAAPEYEVEGAEPEGPGRIVLP
jgi:hypothetical protein